MRILWFTWKDKTHPFAGGAEKVDEVLATQLVQDGHTLVMITSGYPNGKHKEKINGYEVIRVGNQYTVYFEASQYYKKHLRGWADLIIEEVNTIPFLTQWYAKEKRILLIYQLCRSVWFYQLGFPFNLIGYLVEPMYLWLMRKNKVITESESTKKDLQNYGFKAKNINIFPVSIELKPLEKLADKKTYEDFTVLSLGSIRSMKRTMDQVKAFEIAKAHIPELKMKIAGAVVAPYGKKVLEYIQKSKFRKDIEFFHTITKQKKQELMKKSHLILVTSVKEGWGLIVTEAASQGTPAIVYDVDGLRDSVEDKKTGIICQENTPQSMAEEIVNVHKDTTYFHSLQKDSLEMSKQYTETHSYNAFKKIILKQ